MHKARYSLAYNPFDKESYKKGSHFESEDFRQMTGRLGHLTNTRGIGLFTASPGYGKTYCLREFFSGLNPNLHMPIYICLSTVSVAEFYRQLCIMLGIVAKGGKPGMFRAIQEQVVYQYKEKRQPLLLAIDEAQYLSTGILNDIKMLMNYKCDSINCFSLILCGEPHLNRILSTPIHEALRQRITVHYNFKGLTDQEAVDYIIHKLCMAGSSKAVINEAALSAVAGHAHGNPRVIDTIMSDALIIGSQQDKTCIDADVILAAVENRNLG